MNNYRVVTVTSGRAQAWYYLQEEFYKSLNGHEALTLQPQHWGGLMTKPRTLYAAIEQGMIPEEYMIFADSWDLVFAATPEEIIETYLTFGADVVISAEANCFPADFKEDYDKQADPKTPYNYLNSGFIVGKTQAIFECLKAMDLPSIPDDHYSEEFNMAVHPNDQFEWQKIYLKQPVKIELDRMQVLSQTLHGADINNFELVDAARVKNKLTNTYPCSLHFNGGSKDDLSLRGPLLKHLNLL